MTTTMTSHLDVAAMLAVLACKACLGPFFMLFLSNQYTSRCLFEVSTFHRFSQFFPALLIDFAQYRFSTDSPLFLGIAKIFTESNICGNMCALNGSET